MKRLNTKLVNDNKKLKTKNRQKFIQQETQNFQKNIKIILITNDWVLFLVYLLLYSLIFFLISCYLLFKILVNQLEIV